MRRFRRSQEGQALFLLIGFMALAVPLMTSALGLVSTLSIDSRIKTEITMSHQSTAGGLDHARDRLIYDPAFVVTGTTTYPLTTLGRDISITVVNTSDPGDLPMPDPKTSRSFQLSKTVSPTTAPPTTLTTYTYTAIIENYADDEKTVTSVRDDFPTGLSYVNNTSELDGVPIANPGMSGGNLNWSLTGDEGTFPPFSSKVFEFQMDGALPQGVYCNDIWVTPLGRKTGSGLTAKIVVGSPASTLCPGTAIQMTKTVDLQTVLANIEHTFTYTVTLISDGTDPVDVKTIIDLMPPDFTYQLGTTVGAITADPSIGIKNGNQEELKWSANPLFVVAPGGTDTFSFKVKATPTVGSYFNQIEADVSGLSYDLFVWPTAQVEVFEKYLIRAVDTNGTTATTGFLLTPDGPLTQTWNITR